MAPGEERAAQIDFNMELTRKADGLLAKASGQEHLLSIGCGHTVAFCKAAKAGCRTSQKSIQDSKGNINLQLLYADGQYKSMLDDGWDWEIIPAWIDKKYPKFANIGQKALNSSNNVASVVSEMEAAKAIADHMKDCACHSGWQQEAAEAVASIGAPCAPYCSHIVKFVDTFSGGADAPMVDFLDSVSKQFQCNVTIGETFWRTIVSAQWQTEQGQLPLLRVGLLLANLTSPKIEDGVARLLVKSDVSKLCVKSMLSDCLAVEKSLGQAITIAKSASASKRMRVDAEHGPLGRMFVRMILKLTDKEKLGAEGVAYTSYAPICDKYLAEMSELLGGLITFDGWTPAKPNVEGEKQAPVPKSAGPISLDQHNSPVWLAEQKGFTVSKLVYEKSTKRGPTNLFVIVELNDAFVALEPACDYEHSGKRIRVELGALLKEWGNTDAEPPFQLCNVESSEKPLSTDTLKAKMFLALVAAKKKYEKTDVLFYRRPDHVRSGKNYAASELTLTPFAPMANISAKKVLGISLGKHKLAGDQQELWLVPPAKPPLNASEKQVAESSLCAFFWVEITAVECEANMKEAEIDINGFKITVMQNFKPLKVHAKLLTYKSQKQAAAPLSNVMFVTAQAEPSGTRKDVQKRQRTR